ncbi:MAG: 16S rRNA (guanine(527)-N(7))-methyltransferase RsmG [Clostridiaceae bacterium]|nr:16S rRNA (guanine(527)-N(7))-methyltransferase RsmG [Clostridiaceae bacterium]
MQYLCDEAAKIGITLSEKQLADFLKYYEAVVEYNKSVNLTAITEKIEFTEKHFLDSLAGAEFLPQGAKFIDIGSGAGFPAIPLKLVRPDLKMTLLDSLNKRVAFLRQATALLKLTDITALHVRAEDAAHTTLRESFNVCAARAVAALPVLLEYASPFVKPGGIFIAYKTDEVELTAAENAAAELKMQLLTVKKYSLPAGNVRALFVFEKTAPLPAKYPRPQAQIKKHPL